MYDRTRILICAVCVSTWGYLNVHKGLLAFCIHVRLWMEEEGLCGGLGKRTVHEESGFGEKERLGKRYGDVGKWLGARAWAEGEEPWGEGWIKGWRELEKVWFEGGGTGVRGRAGLGGLPSL